jgi:predicted nucleotidyltransferase component of viral defense system
MGKITFTPLQQSLFDKIAQHPFLSKTFYFTGGTALNAVYLHHRESEDLDFFSETDFEDERIEHLMKNLSISFKTLYRFTKKGGVRICEFVKKDKLLIKIDFNHYPYKRIEKGKIHQGIEIDSLHDIATNKLLTINQRNDAKDFVDLYFLLKDFTIWDLIYSVLAKFRMELDIVLIASDFRKVEEIDFLPKMLVPLKLSDLKKFFKQKAIELAKRVTE